MVINKLSKNQENSLIALMNTFIATLNEDEKKELSNHHRNRSQKKEDENELKQIEKLASIQGTDMKDCTEKIITLMYNATPTVKHSQILSVLSLLNTSVGSYLLTGHMKPFSSLSRQQREAVLLKWKNSSLVPIRQLYRIFGIMVLHTNYGFDDALRKSIGYPYTVVK